MPANSSESVDASVKSPRKGRATIFAALFLALLGVALGAKRLLLANGEGLPSVAPMETVSWAKK